MINHLDIKSLKQKFINNQPFPHIVIDNFLKPEVADKVLSEFPSADDEVFTWKSNDTNSIKQMCQDSSIIKQNLPYIWSVIEYLNSEELLEQVSEFTSMPQLYGDNELSGGGLHLIKQGGHLKLHVDFNIADSLPDLNRRLNIILFMNPKWESEWNGQLELWDTECKECITSVEPIFNRAVIFDTQPKDNVLPWHGHPTPLTCPKDVYRKSLALYYYSKEKPSTKMAEKHKTLYQK
jgi:Rps23 Pro-64 3,4-dihydroxylase Tpa1-like proline 4-hydroxylase